MEMSTSGGGGGSPVLAFVGDGSDGAVNFDGTNTFAGFASKSGNTYTLTRDVFATTLIVASGVTLATASFRIQAKASVTNNGTISNVGGDAITTAAGNATATNSLLGSGAGTAGVTAINAAGGGSLSNCLGGQGGSGGGGNGGGGASGGGAFVPSAANSGWRQLETFATGALVRGGSGSITNLAPGAGGAGGGGDLTNKGGGGGAGGGFIVITTPALVNNGIITAQGGAGGTPTTGIAGPGGGGGGGVIILNLAAAVTGSGSLNVAGGTTGSPIGGGGTGSVPAAAGAVFTNVW